MLPGRQIASKPPEKVHGEGTVGPFQSCRDGVFLPQDVPAVRQSSFQRPEEDPGEATCLSKADGSAESPVLIELAPKISEKREAVGVDDGCTGFVHLPVTGLKDVAAQRLIFGVV